jgi:AraC-like DNA-binding protein
MPMRHDPKRGDGCLRMVPLVRAGIVKPLLQAAARQGVPIERRLAEVGLAAYPWDEAERPIPLLAGLDLLRRVADRDGVEDLGCRVEGAESRAGLGRFGPPMFTARTPREVLQRAVAMASGLCSHQQILVRQTRAGPVVKFVFPRSFDPAGVHVSHQYSAMIVKAVLEAAAPGEQPFRRIVISPGKGTTDGLHAALGCEVLVCEGNTLSLQVDPDIFERPFPSVSETVAPFTWVPLDARAGFVAFCRELIDRALDTTTPTIGQLASAAGTSVRTLQRELALEGTTFRALLDDVRRARVLGALQESHRQLADIAGDLGYAEQTCLSRAVRRWTGTTPKRLRPAGQPPLGADRRPTPVTGR